MCGIFGYTATFNLMPKSKVLQARDSMYSRGPDDAGYQLITTRTQGQRVGEQAIKQYVQHNTWTALAHRRLSIMDLSTAGHQPFQSPCGRYYLIYNGELYHLDRLRQHLVQRNIQLKTRCDTEILLHLLILYKEKVFPLLNGMFAFAFWDQHSQRLILGRDSAGIKPLYYSVLNPKNTSNEVAKKINTSSTTPIIFASQVKALLASGVVSDQLNLMAHLDYLSLTYTPSPQTSLEHIQQLPAGHYLSWQVQSGINIQAYQRINTQSYPYPTRWSHLAEQLRQRLCAAVDTRLVSDVPVGIFLSGGVDSTALLYAAKQVATQDLHTFTIKFEEQSFDESGYARSVASAFNTIHHETLVRPNPDEFMGPLMQALDQPFADSSAIPLWYLCKTAKQHVTVALGGDGGDELLAGYKTHQAAMLASYYRKLPTYWTQKIAQWAQHIPVSHKKISWDLKLKQFTQAAYKSRCDSYAGFKNFLPQALKEQLCQPLYQRLYDDYGDFPNSGIERHFEPYFNTRAIGDHELSTYLHCDQALYLPDNILTKADRVSMGHSLELRVPFLDQNVSQWINHLPPQYKWSLKQNKRILKYALKGRVPDHVLQRSKAGFNVPMAQWLLGTLKPLCDDLLSANEVRKVGLWSPRWVDYMRQEHEERRQDFSRPLWAMLCFMIFNQYHRHGKEA
jgi:asparagine synthase (glutamine-hydrolysing)